MLKFVQIRLAFSHGTIEIGQIRAPFAGQIRDQEKLGFEVLQTSVNTESTIFK
jgi:hypothetical protein